MQLLIVKTSSMGDVVHAQPVVADILAAHPQAQVDWLVEPSFAAIPEMNPGIRQVHRLPWRRWRRQLWQPATWRAMVALQGQLRRPSYDLVLDLQGLLKSALWAGRADAPVAGFDAASAREPLAARLYQRRAAVPGTLHAVERCRRLAAAHLGYELPPGPPAFGLQPSAGDWRPRAPYAVLIPNASRLEKLWPERHWIAVGQRLLRAGWMAQELLSTFGTELGEVVLVPGTGGVFTITCDDSLIWDRKRDGGFPDAAKLKQLVRDVIDPDRDLGHSDRKARDNA